MIEFDNATVGKTIKRLRKEKHLSQEVLSGLAGIGRSHLSMIETGAKQASFETLWKISSALDILPHELVKKIEENIVLKNEGK